MTRIKLCGIRTPADVEAINLAAPDYAGFVFSPCSRRFVTPEEAHRLITELDGSIIPVGVFLDADKDYVAVCTARSGISMMQLHGDIGDSAVRGMMSAAGIPAIQAFRVRSEKDIADAACSSADMVLLDNGYGGTGERFDWSLSAGLGRDFFLAGGLTPDNVKDAVKNFRPYAVDVSTGIETGNAKDPEKIDEFIKAVRSADSEAII